MNSPTNANDPADMQVDGANSHQHEGVTPVNHNTKRAEANLALAANIMERKGWTVARLIAASVEPGHGAGTNQHTEVSATSGDLGKVSINKATSLLHMSDHTIRGYLAAWDRAANDGLCVPASELTPEDSETALLPDAEWGAYYVASNFGGNVQDAAERVRRNEEYSPAPAPAPERNPGATLTEWASSEIQMKGIVTGTTGSAQAARRFVSEAIKADPAVAAAADQALEDRTKEKAPPRKDAPATNRDHQQYELAALMQARKIRRESKALASMVHDLDGTARDSVTTTLTDCIDVLEIIKTSLQGEESMDAALAALLDGEG